MSVKKSAGKDSAKNYAAKYEAFTQKKWGDDNIKQQGNLKQIVYSSDLKKLQKRIDDLEARIEKLERKRITNTDESGGKSLIWQRAHEPTLNDILNFKRGMKTT